MLTIWKLGVGGEDYYLDKIAKGVEDYYSGDGELPGRWMGRGAGRLGLAGEVGPDELRSLMAGINPRTGDRLAGRPGAKHVAGWDLTFAAPKSVSLVYALGDQHAATQVAAAHDAAVAAGLAYLENHAVASRRRKNGVVTTVRAEGLIVAAFRHRTSRAGDPHLHTHALALNAVEHLEGGWGALHSPVLYRHARTAGFVYQAVLRGELTERLGLAWGPVHNGYAEVDGIEHRFLEAFSKRHTEIESVMTSRGEDSARAAAVAQRRTRPGKAFGVDPNTLHDRWMNEAHALGLDPEAIAGLGGQAAPHMSIAALSQLMEEMTSPTGLTLRRASFDRGDVIRAWCDALPGGAEISVESLEALVDEVLQRGDVVPIIDGSANLPGHQVLLSAAGTVTTSSLIERRWSTTELLEVEQELLQTAASSQGLGMAQLPIEVVDGFLATRTELSDEQAALVRQITVSGNGVDLVVGRAGSGKTYALAAAAEAWRAGGYRPIGLGLAARVAYELETSAAIPSTTVEQFLIDIDHASPGIVHRRNVIIVDEAGMVDTRRLADVVYHAVAAGAKVVLVGDHHQLPAVEAGGAFAALVARLGATELTENRRQREVWERDTLARLRVGDGGENGIAGVIARYGEHGRIHVGTTPADVRAAMVADWHEARRRGEHVAMLALRRADVAELNSRARATLVDDGTVAANGITVGDKTFGVGDRVVCLDGDRRLGVHNALFGTVVATHEEGGLAVQAEGTSRVLELPRHYLEDGHLDHAYATTIHKAQGATYDRALLLGDQRLYRQAGYTGMSRGRDRNDLYVVTEDDRDDDPELERHSWIAVPEDEPLTRLVKAFHRDGAKLLASDERDHNPGWGSAPRLGSLWAEWDQLVTWLQDHAPPDHSDQLKVIEDLVATAASQAAQATLNRHVAEERLHQLSHASRRGRVHTERRLAAATEHEQRRLQEWQELHSQHAEVVSRQQTRNDWLQEHSEQLTRLGDLHRSIRYRTRLAGRVAEVDRPDHVLAALGPPPTDLEGRERWRDAASAIESYRARWDTDLTVSADNSRQVRHLAHVQRAIEAARQDPVHDELVLRELA